jgi:hypothetical protein
MFMERLKNTMESLMIVSDLAEIGTKHPSNTSLELYHSTNNLLSDFPLILTSD